VTHADFCAKPGVGILEDGMIKIRPVILMVLVASVGLSACGRKDRPLMNLRSTGAGPDEFSILPTKPLKMPKSFASLPEPTPGAGNLADPRPEADAVAALGGNPKYLEPRGKLPRSDSALIATATRYGISKDIRDVLAAEDKEFRRSHPPKLLERAFKVSAYFKVYAPMALDRYAELARLRRAGVRTPAAPPKDQALKKAVAAAKARKKLKKITN